MVLSRKFRSILLHQTMSFAEKSVSLCVCLFVRLVWTDRSRGRKIIAATEIGYALTLVVRAAPHAARTGWLDIVTPEFTNRKRNTNKADWDTTHFGIRLWSKLLQGTRAKSHIQKTARSYMSQCRIWTQFGSRNQDKCRH